MCRISFTQPTASSVNIDWGKVLHYLTRDRQLVRAAAYAPVSDDAYQRIETQRFVQPFYKLPYKILTKPLKRFGNGEIKANFDVELAIDVITMADRLDIVCLVSGDGDFRRMVELVQAKGVRVEVVAFSSSTAGELRAACDEYIDFAEHLHEFCETR
ncbi:MAG: NYN domain-containing protein [Dehalococcoidia bacterium]